MRFLITLSILSCILLFSCQKESGFSINNNTSGGGGGTSGLLVRLVSKSGSDSSILTFGYNSSSKLITFNIQYDASDPNGIIRERIERNAQGIIQKIIFKSDVYQQAGLDSVIARVGYNSGKYTYKVTSFDYVFLVAKDSTALIYDGAGKVITEKSFVDNGLGSYQEYRKADYTYTGNNIATVKNYSFDASTSSYSLVETYTYDQYDNKISPIYFGIEGILFGSAGFISSNNPTKSSITATGNPTDNYTITYTYNSSNKPLTASSTVQPGNATVSGKYYYQ